MLETCPVEPNFSIFMQFSANILLNNRLVPPLGLVLHHLADPGTVTNNQFVFCIIATIRLNVIYRRQNTKKTLKIL